MWSSRAAPRSRAEQVSSSGPALAKDYQFTVDWFTGHAWFWQELFEREKPRRFLEIGSYEGRASCFMIELAAAERDIELHCVDTWQGSVEHERGEMNSVEARFDANIARAMAAAPHTVHFRKHKAPSSEALVQMLAAGVRGHFDWIYVDGSHQAPDVLADAVLAFMLLRVGGILVFDDYLWSMEEPGSEDFFQLPKPAIDAFINLYRRKVSVIPSYVYQLYARKIAH